MKEINVIAKIWVIQTHALPTFNLSVIEKAMKEINIIAKYG